MAEQNGARADRVAALANRLRLLQIDFADQSDDVRRDYLSEEVTRALSSVVPSERKAFLEELQARFPTWDGRVEVIQNPATRSAFDERQLGDPSFLLGKLVEVFKALPPERRRAVTDRLQEAGLVGVGQPDWPQATAAEVKAKLQMGPQDQISAPRALEALALLCEFICSLDQAVWKTWQMIAPQSKVKRAAPLQATIGKFLADDAKASRGRVADDVNVLRQLIVSLVFSIPQAGRFAIQHFKALSPDEIKVLVGTSGFGLDAKYWRKYVELYESNDMGAVDDAIKKAIGEFAEALIRGQR